MDEAGLTDKELEREREEAEYRQQYDQMIRDTFTDRELGIIRNALIYAQNEPAGLPGHNLMVIIDKLCGVLGFVFPSDLEEKWIDESQ